MFVASAPRDHLGKTIDTGHCVRLVQVAAGAPHTSAWRPGRRVRGGSVPTGTVIATFSPDGRYENDVTGKSHAAIFLEEVPDGLQVIDQWQGHPVAQRLIRFRDGQGAKVNDGDQFFVVTADA